MLNRTSEDQQNTEHSSSAVNSNKKLTKLYNQAVYLIIYSFLDKETWFNYFL